MSCSNAALLPYLRFEAVNDGVVATTPASGLLTFYKNSQSRLRISSTGTSSQTPDWSSSSALAASLSAELHYAYVREGSSCTGVASNQQPPYGGVLQQDGATTYAFVPLVGAAASTAASEPSASGAFIAARPGFGSLRHSATPGRPLLLQALVPRFSTSSAASPLLLRPQSRRCLRASSNRCFSVTETSRSLPAFTASAVGSLLLLCFCSVRACHGRQYTARRHRDQQLQSRASACRSCQPRVSERL